MVTDGESEAEVFLFFHSIHGFWNVETTNSTGISSISLSKVVDGQIDTSTSKEGSAWLACTMDMVDTRVCAWPAYEHAAPPDDTMFTELQSLSSSPPLWSP